MYFHHGCTYVALIPAPCPPGYRSIDGLNPCEPCPVNYYSDVSAARVCTECPRDQVTLYAGSSHYSLCISKCFKLTFACLRFIHREKSLNININEWSATRGQHTPVCISCLMVHSAAPGWCHCGVSSMISHARRSVDCEYAMSFTM